MSSKQPSRPLPDTWELNTLESLLAVSIGGIWGVESGLSEVKVDVVRVTELKAHGFIEPSTAAKRSITRKQFQSRALEVGDLLLEKSGGGPNSPVGRVGYVLSIDKPMVCSNFMQLMRPDAKRVFPKYLHFFLTFIHSNGETIAMQTSTTNIRNIKTPEYMAVNVPVPSLQEQGKIVEILEKQLSRLDAALASVHSAREKSARFRRSLLHAAFIGALSGQDISKNNLPTTWKFSELSSLLEVSIGGIWGEEVGVSEINVDVVRVTELKSHGVIDPTTAARRSVTSKQLNSRALQVGDLLLEKSGGGPNTPVGRVGFVHLVTGPMVCSNFMQLMRPSIKVMHPKFLHLFLTFFHSNGGTIPMQTATTNIRNIKSPEYMAILVPTPQIEEQERIVEILEEQLSRLDAALLVADVIEKKASALRRSLLHAAFSGDLTKEWREGAHV
jgi:type I restriction enzyme S subunit